MFTPELSTLAASLLTHCRLHHYCLTSAESCTGGLVGGVLTSLPGSSDVFERGFITYSNDAKRELLDVEDRALRDFGAVSEIVAGQMAMGAIAHSKADFAVSVTGIAGPGGGSLLKPVGLVYFGIALRSGHFQTFERRFGDVGRDGIRLASVTTAIDLLMRATGASNQAL